MKWYFGIITDGKDFDLLERVVNRIKDFSGVSAVICGNTTNVPFDNALRIHAPDHARMGRLGAMRNLLVDQRGDADMVVIMDDDIILHDNFIQGFDKFGYEGWDVASCKILNPDGTRYWDWKIHKGGMNWLLDYDQTNRRISLTGGLIIAKSYVFEKACWDPSLGFYEREDVAFSDVLRSQGFKIVFNPYSTVTHEAPYTQKGSGVYRTDL